VPRKIQADFLIGDHAQKDIPAGFTSWRFIEQSVKNGCLEDPDAYKISPTAPTARASVVNKPKGIRVPFSTADDELLRAWVARPESQAAGTNCNAIFRELEAQVSSRRAFARNLTDSVAVSPSHLVLLA
jgi:hypothetical protein